ncbi:MAG: alpha/beta hydrolase [Burkholderiaceae bacterium]
MGGAAQPPRASPSKAIDLPYGEHPTERLDLFRAARPTRRCWSSSTAATGRALDKRDFSWVAAPYVAKGVAVAIVNYALLPAVTLEHIVRQNVAALAWLWLEGPKLGFDRNRIVVSGHSAGGHLTAMMLAARWRRWDRRLPADLVRAGVSISGVFDIRPLTQAAFLNQDLQLDQRSARRLSPGLMSDVQALPLLASVGERESSEFHRQGRLIKAARAPRTVTLLSLKGRDHMSACDALAEPRHELFRRTLRICHAT